MSEEKLPNPTTEIKQPRQPKDNTQIVKVALTILLILFASFGLIFVGFWYGQQSDKQKEVSEGDEFQETDPQWKKAMQEVTPDPNEKLPLIPYRNDTHKFSFEYPSIVFLEPTDGVKLPLVYLDTQLIVLPQAYGGFLTPVEIRVPPLITSKTVTEQVIAFKNSVYKNSYQEKVLPSSLKGVWARGKCEGFPCDGEVLEEVILAGPKGLVVINFLPTETFSQNLFDQILATFQFLD